MSESFAFLANANELAPTRESLLERLRNLEDGVSWQEFFDTYWKLIYRAAIRLGLRGSDAEEVVQETVITVARNINDFRYDPRECSFKGWLMIVARTRVIDRYRSRQRQPSLESLPLTPEFKDDESAGSPEETPGEESLQVIDAAAARAFEAIWNEEWDKGLVDAAMQRIKRRINPEHYQIFYLYKVKGMPVREISQLLGVSAAKIYVVQHRVAAQIKQELKQLQRE